jgi:hypothetical protein
MIDDMTQFLIRFLLIIACFLIPATLHAAEKENSKTVTAPDPIIEDCFFKGTKITRLHLPAFKGNYKLQLRHEIKDHALRLQHTHAMTGKEYVTYGLLQSPNGEQALYLGKINPRGRIYIDKKIPLSADETILKYTSFVINGKEQGYVFKKKDLGQGVIYTLYKIDDNALTIQPIFTNSLTHKGEALSDFWLSPEGQYIYLTGNEIENQTRKSAGFLSVYNIPQNAFLWKRSYSSGQENTITSIHKIQDDHFILLGTLTEKSTKAALLIKIDKEGIVEWQRSFVRGRDFRLSATQQIGENLFVVGDADPSSKKDLTGLSIMKIDLSGSVLWQRFFDTKDYHLRYIDQAVEKDGRLIIAAQAIPHNIEEKDHYKIINKGGQVLTHHVRLLTLTSNGSLLSDQSQTSGINAFGTSLTRAKQGISQYILTGFYQSISKKTTAPIIAYEGWALLLDPLTPYKNSCIPE